MICARARSSRIPITFGTEHLIGGPPGGGGAGLSVTSAVQVVSAPQELAMWTDPSAMASVVNDPLTTD